MQLELCGASVFVHESGSGENNLLLLHGWGCSTQLMASVQSEMEKTMRVAALDFPGHGRSGRPPEPWGVPEYMEMTAQALYHACGFLDVGYRKRYYEDNREDALIMYLEFGGER